MPAPPTSAGSLARSQHSAWKPERTLVLAPTDAVRRHSPTNVKLFIQAVEAWLRTKLSYAGRMVELAR